MLSIGLLILDMNKNRNMENMKKNHEKRNTVYEKNEKEQRLHKDDL